MVIDDQRVPPLRQKAEEEVVDVVAKAVVGREHGGWNKRRRKEEQGSDKTEGFILLSLYLPMSSSPLVYVALAPLLRAIRCPSLLLSPLSCLSALLDTRDMVRFLQCHRDLYTHDYPMTALPYAALTATIPNPFTSHHPRISKLHAPLRAIAFYSDLFQTRAFEKQIITTAEMPVSVDVLGNDDPTVAQMCRLFFHPKCKLTDMTIQFVYGVNLALASELLQHHTSLQALSLRSTMLSHVELGLLSPHILRSASTLTSLHLCVNVGSINTVVPLVGILERLPHLRTLSLEQNTSFESEFVLLLTCLLTHHLRKLKINIPAFPWDDETCHAMTRFSMTTHMKDLDVYAQGGSILPFMFAMASLRVLTINMRRVVDDEMAFILQPPNTNTTTLATHNHLHTLTLHFFWSEHSSPMVAFWAQLGNNKSITKFTFHAGNLHDYDYSSIGRMLTTNTTMREFAMTVDVDVDFKQAGHITSGIRVNVGLTHMVLGVGDCPFSWFSGLCAALAHHPTIHSVTVRSGVTETAKTETSDPIWAWLANSPRLKKLVMPNLALTYTNPFMMGLSQALRTLSLSNLQHLDIGRVFCDHSLIGPLLSAVTSHPSLQVFRCYIALMTHDAALELCRLLSQNTILRMLEITMSHGIDATDLRDILWALRQQQTLHVLDFYFGPSETIPPVLPWTQEDYTVPPLDARRYRLLK